MSYALKFFSLAWFFTILFIVSGVQFLLHYFSSGVQRLFIGFLSIILLITFYANQSLYKQFLYHNGKESHMSEAELQTATFLQSQKGPVFLISDPGTQGILEALSNTNSQGGVYMDLKTRQILAQVSKNNPEKVKKELSLIHDNLSTPNSEKRFFVVSGRYMAWQRLPKDERNSIYFNIWRPRTLSAEDLETVNTFRSVAGLSIVYRNPEIVVFAL